MRRLQLDAEQPYRSGEPFHNEKVMEKLLTLGLTQQ
jgi:hypothetical protein